MPDLQPFLYATNEISFSTRVLVHEVIPFIDGLTKRVDDVQDNASFFPAVRLAARRARAVLNKYYSLTDDTPIYRIAMSTSIILGTD